MSEKIGEGDVNIDRAVYEGGIGPETATSTGEVSDRCDRCNCALTTAGVCVLCGWSRSTAPRRDVSAIEKVLDRLPSGGADDLSVICERFVVNVKEANAARAELAALRAENAAQAKQIETMRDVVRLAADMIPETDEHILAAMARTTAIVAQSVLSSTVAAVTTDALQRAAKDATIERLRKALEHAASYMVTLCMDRPVQEDGEVVGHWQTTEWLIGLRELAEESHSIALFSLPPSDAPKPIEALQRAASRACDVMSECVEHGECAGADRAEMRAAEKQLLGALLGNSSGSPNGSQAVVPRERLREIEWAAEGSDVRGGEVTTYAACPACGGAEPRFAVNQPSLLGHAPDCWLGNAIHDAENRV